MIKYRQSVKIQRRTVIPTPFLPYLEFNGEKDVVYFYVHVSDDNLYVSMSLNQPVDLEHILYKDKFKVSAKYKTISVPKTIFDIFDVEGEYRLWEVHDEKPEIRFKFERADVIHDELNQVVCDVMSCYKAETLSIRIPDHIYEVKEFHEKDKVFCGLYRHNGKIVVMVNNIDDHITTDEYHLRIIFLAHLTGRREKYLVLDGSLGEYLKLTDKEEVFWSTYYNNDNVFIGFERTFKNVVTHEYTGLVSNVFNQNRDFYTKIPEEIFSALRLKDKPSVLWKRFKQGELYRINLVHNQPRFRKHRKTGKIIEEDAIDEEGIVKIPNGLIERFDITRDNFIYWRINDEDRRYTFAELKFF